MTGKLSRDGGHDTVRQIESQKAGNFAQNWSQSATDLSANLDLAQRPPGESLNLFRPSRRRPTHDSSTLALRNLNFFGLDERV